jgi:hypothetical protein
MNGMAGVGERSVRVLVGKPEAKRLLGRPHNRRNDKITVEFQLSGLIGTASHPDMQKIWIIGFYLKIGYIGNVKFGC